MSVSIRIVHGESPSPPPAPPRRMKLAFIKHQPNRSGFDIQYYPDTCVMQDEGKGDLKGRTIPIRENWWRYIEKINDLAGYRYARSIGAMWINIPYDNEIPYSTGRAESIDCGGNFIEWDVETGTHVRRVDYPNNMNTSVLNPLVDNWKVSPHRFWKAVAIDKEGKKINPVSMGKGADVYIPRICNESQFGKPAGTWIRKDKLIFLPEDEYTFQNGSVWKDGALFYPTGTIPPLG
jgi:hypothetical protein